MISVKPNGDFRKTTDFLKRIKDVSKLKNLREFGEKGVEALKSMTPLDSGKTINSWYYEIEETNKGYKISFCNSNVNDGVPIAIILQYGHGTNNGGWVEGRDYINPAIQPVFDKIVSEAWKEVTRQ